MKLYCSSCGADNSYTMQKPNFCKKCGDSFSGTSNASGTTQSTSLDEEDRDVNQVPNLSKLDFDISGNDQVKGISLEALSRIQAPDRSGRYKTSEWLGVKKIKPPLLRSLSP